MISDNTKERILFIVNHDKNAKVDFEASPYGFCGLQDTSIAELYSFAKEIEFNTGRKTSIETKNGTKEVFVRNIVLGHNWGCQPVYERRNIAILTLVVYPQNN